MGVAGMAASLRHTSPRCCHKGQYISMKGGVGAQFIAPKRRQAESSRRGRGWAGSGGDALWCASPCQEGKALSGAGRGRRTPQGVPTTHPHRSRPYGSSVPSSFLSSFFLHLTLIGQGLPHRRERKPCCHPERSEGSALCPARDPSLCSEPALSAAKG
jgi:hypothetical protein